MDVKVALESSDGTTEYAATILGNVTEEWTWHQATLRVTPASIDPHGRLSITFTGPGTLGVDVVSLMPEANALVGGLEPWPFREDLIQRLRDLKPR